MARTQIAFEVDTTESGNIQSAGTAIDATNGMYLDVTGKKAGQVLIIAKNSFSGSKTMTLKAGAANPPAYRKGLGDVVVTFAAQNDIWAVRIASARQVQTSGGATGVEQINIDFAASATGTIWAYYLPI